MPINVELMRQTTLPARRDIKDPRRVIIACWSSEWRETRKEKKRKIDIKQKQT